MTRRSIGLFVLGGLAVALLLAFVVSPWASSEPDGLERVAIDQGFADNATDHATAGSPLADYAVSGVDHSWLPPPRRCRPRRWQPAPGSRSPWPGWGR